MSIKVDVDVCRVCLKSGSGPQLFDDPNLVKQFHFATQLQISEHDGLPGRLCYMCWDHLKISYDFRRQCIISDTEMRRLINRANTEFKQIANTTSNTMKELFPNDVPKELITKICYDEVDFVDNDDISVDENGGKDNLSISEQQTLDEQNTEEQLDLTEMNSADELDDDDNDNNNDVHDNGQCDEDGDEFTKYIQEDSIVEQYYGEDEGVLNTDDEELLEQQSHDDYEHENGEDVLLKNQEVHVLHTDDMDESISEIVLSNPLEINDVKDDSTNDLINSLTGEIIGSENGIIKIEKILPCKSESYYHNSVSENSLHLCTKCDKDFSTKTNLIRHLQTHDGVKPYQCPICGNGFTQNGSLKAHMLIHTGERPYVCNVCCRGFTQSKSLTFHMRRHTGEKPFTCDICNLSFRQKDGLKRHTQIKHSGISNEDNECTICNRILSSTYALTLHMRKHTNRTITSFKCQMCSKIFRNKYKFQDHLQAHNGKQFKCSECNKEFIRKNNYLNHMKKHDETPANKTKVYKPKKKKKST